MFSGLFGWHAVILLVLIGLPIIFGVILLRRARRARATGDTTPIVSLTLTIAALYAALCLIAATIGLLSTLLSPAVTLTVPVAQYWPLPMPGVTIEGAPAHVVDGGFTSAQLAIEGLATPARLLWAIGQFLGLMVPTAMAALIALVCFQLLRGATFAPLVARAALTTAAVVLVGGLSSQFLCGIAGSMASQQALFLGASTITGYPDEFDIWDALPQSTYAMQVDFWPLGAALAFAALAAVFRYGSRLQRETEGLV